MEDNAGGSFAIAARAPGFLHELLKAAGHAKMEHETDAGDVDAHSEGGGGDYQVERCRRGGGSGVDEGGLNGFAGVFIEASVVGGGGYRGLGKFEGESVGGGAEGDVDQARYGCEDGWWDGVVGILIVEPGVVIDEGLSTSGDRIEPR